jgi:cytochrome c biogenesis factor
MLAAGTIASSFYSVQRDFALSPGGEASLGRYKLTYRDLAYSAYPDREERVAEFDVYSGDSYLGVMRPKQTIYPNFGMAANRGAIRSTPIEDFYIVPSELGGDGPAVFRVLINPMVWWIWASGPVLVLGVLLALSPQRRPAPAVVRVLERARIAGS